MAKPISKEKIARERAEKRLSELFKGQWPTTKQAASYFKLFYLEELEKLK